MCVFLHCLQQHIPKDHEYRWKRKREHQNIIQKIHFYFFLLLEVTYKTSLCFDLSIFLKYYDVRKQCKGSLCYDFSNMEKFLNQKSVRTALGVGDIEFVSCSTAVYDAMQLDWMRNLEVGIPALLEDGIKMLIYAGEYDLICNWLGRLPLLYVHVLGVYFRF